MRRFFELPKRVTRPRSRQAGFTLMELIVVIAVIGLLFGAAAPVVVQQIDQQRTAETREAMVRIHQGMWGSREAVGFVGDIGRLPNSLAELTTQGGLPASTTSTQNGVRMGWTGPYVNLGFNAASALKDRWGTDYTYSTGAGLLAGQIRSPGADRTNGTADDLTYPTAAFSVNGTVIVNLHVWHTGKGIYTSNPSYASDTTQVTTVTLYHSNAGAQASTVLTTAVGLSPPFTFTNVHRGYHAITTSSTFKSANPALTTSLVIFVEGNANQTTVDLYLGGPG